MTITTLLKYYHIPILRIWAYKCIKKKGCEIPLTVKVGKNVVFPHDSVGLVIHPQTTIGDNVKIYQNVTIGRADIWQEAAEDFGGICIEDGAILCAGAKILGRHGTLRVGKETIIAANAVLLSNADDYEVWGGIPAKKIGTKFKEKI